MNFALLSIIGITSFAGQIYASSLTINCNNLGGLTESLSVVQTELQTTVSIKSIKAKQLLEKLLGEKSISGIFTRIDFSIPRSCKVSHDNAFSFYCSSRDVKLTFSGDQVIDVRGQDIGFRTHNSQTITPTDREESVIAGLSIYSIPQQSGYPYPGFSSTFTLHEVHSGQLSNPGNTIIGKKCLVAAN